MLKINKKQIIILLIILVLIGWGIYYISVNNEQDDMDYLYLEENIKEEEKIESNEIDLKEKNKKQIVVHMTGQVVNCGIVKLEENSRIIDAIEAAGGVTSDADLNKINLAYILSDGQKIYIPSINDEEQKVIVTQGSGEEVIQESESIEQKIININIATSQQLQKLPGIGESIANKIISYRISNGKFEKIEDLKNVSGIGEAKFNSIKEYICVK